MRYQIIIQTVISKIKVKRIVRYQIILKSYNSQRSNRDLI